MIIDLFRQPFENLTSAPAIFVIRTEFLWRDWSMINELLGQTPGTVVYNDALQKRNTTKYVLPVKAIIGEEQRNYLCNAIASEYMAYFELLSNAINLDGDDISKMKAIARTNCPKLKFLQ